MNAKDSSAEIRSIADAADDEFDAIVGPLDESGPESREDGGQPGAGDFLAAKREADQRAGNHHVYKLTRSDGQIRYEAGEHEEQALCAARRRGWIGWKQGAAAEVVYSNGWADPCVLWRVEWFFAGRWVQCAQCMAPTALHAIRVQQGLYGSQYRYRAKRIPTG